MRRRKDMRGPGPLSIRCIFIIIAQLQHYLMPPCLLRSPTSASRTGTHLRIHTEERGRWQSIWLVCK